MSKINIHDDKYDKAIDFLNDLDAKKGGGSYYAECASYIEELLACVFELEEKAMRPQKKSQALLDREAETTRNNLATQKKRLDYLAGLSSPAKAEKE